MAQARALSRRVALALLLVALAACGRDLPGQAVPTATPVEPTGPTATASPRRADPSPTPIPAPSVVGRVTRPAPPKPLDGRGQRLSLVLDGAPWAGQAGLFLAQERGFFAEAGVDVRFDVAGSREAALRSLAGGRAELALVGGLDLVRARSEGASLVSVFVVAPKPLVALIARRDGGPGRPRDLEGRRLAMPDDRTGRAVVEALLRGDGLDPAKVNVVAPGPDPIGALASGAIDAIGGYGPREAAALEARGIPANRFVPEHFGVPEYAELVVATTEDVRRDRGEALRAFAAAAQRGYAEAARSPDGALDVLQRANPSLDRSVAERGVGELASAWRQGPVGPHADVGWRETVAWLGRVGLARPDLDVNAAFTNDFIPRPAPTAVGGASRTPTPAGPTPTPVPRPGAPAPGRVPTVIQIGP